VVGRWQGALVIPFCLLMSLVLSPGARAASSTVETFPIPGSTVASPQTQIAFRGVPVSPVSVVGSQSGAHPGVLLRHTDGLGTSFIPRTPFIAGEVVTVTTPDTVRVAGGSQREFRFRVASPGPQGHCTPHVMAPQVPGEIPHFRSRPDLRPAGVRVLARSAQASRSDLFIDPESGPIQSGPMIVGPGGHLIWFKPLTGYQRASDFKVQRLLGRPVLTWWQGCNGKGGQDVVYDSSYRRLAVVKAANGLWADLHEFNITPRGTALITAYYPVYRRVLTANGFERRLISDSVVQEIDLRSCQRYSTCLVLFQWDSLDHVPVSESRYPGPSSSADYFHVNSAQEDGDGNLIIDSRDTWAVYKVNHQTGRIIWALGGKHSSFTFGPGAAFAFQHNVRVSHHDRVVTMFDDEGGPPAVRPQSRGLKLRLDFKHMRATLVRQYVHTPALQEYVMGSMQQLPNADVFLGWGPSGYFTEYDRSGHVVFDARFAGPDSSYRAYRFSWTGRPATSPDIAASTTAGHTQVYASWNGATDVASWRVLGGERRGRLHPLRVAPRRGFETNIATARKRYVAVEALDRSGRVLGRSPTTTPR
jgi:hypothetical protein